MPTRPLLIAIVALLSISLFTAGSALVAQDSQPAPVGTSSNTVGEVSAAAPVARFVVNSAGSESLVIQALAIGVGLAPHIRVLDPSGAVSLEVSNQAGQGSVSADALLVAPGAYIIEISGELDTIGQFVLILTPAAFSEPGIVDLKVGQPVVATAGQAPLVYQVYGVGMGDQTLTILGTLPNVGPAYRIIDEDSGSVLVSSDGTLIGGTHTLTGADIVYRIEVSSGAGDIPFMICLGCGGMTSPAADTAVASPTVPVTVLQPAAPTATPALGACKVVPSISAGAVNVRRGPGTNFGFVGALRVGQSFPALAQTTVGGVWYKFSLNGVEGWVSASAAHLEGDCAAITGEG